MKAGAGGVLAHHPGVGIADFIHGIRRQPHHIGIPAGYAGVVPANALADLHQGMLHVAGLFVVLQILGQLLIGELPPEPGVPPEEKWHGDDEPCGDEEKNTLAGGHAAAGFDKG